MQISSKAKRIFNIGIKIITWLLVVFSVFMMIFTIVTVTTVDKNDRDIFGFKFYIVQTDSMSKSENNKDIDIHFNAGDIVIIKNLSEEEKGKLKGGEVIAFVSTNDESYLETVTHMIRGPKYDKNGSLLGYVTYGTNTGVNDEALVAPEYVLGSYAGKLPGIGNFFAFVKSTQGYIVCILVPFLLLILYNGVNIIRIFRSYKREQMKEMQAERDKIEAEKAENQRIMQELLSLKAKLEQNGAYNSSSDEPASEALPKSGETDES